MTSFFRDVLGLAGGDTDSGRTASALPSGRFDLAEARVRDGRRSGRDVDADGSRQPRLRRPDVRRQLGAVRVQQANVR